MPIDRPARRARLALALILAAGAAACVPAPDRRPAPPPAPAPAPLPSPSPVANWEDWAMTPGTWRYERDARGSRALFGMAGADARAVLRCDRDARQMFLSRPGTAGGSFTVRTTSRTASVPARPTGGTPPYVAAAFAPRDALLDAMAFSRGRFVVELAGTAPLVLPTYAEIGRVIEDCRG